MSFEQKLGLKKKFEGVDQGSEGTEAGVVAFCKSKETSCGLSSINNLLNIR